MSVEKNLTEPRTGAPAPIERKMAEKLDLPEAEARAVVIQYYALKDAAERKAMENLEEDERAILEVADEFIENAPGIGKEQKKKLEEIKMKRDDFKAKVLRGEVEVRVTKEDYQKREDWYKRNIDHAENNSFFSVVMAAGPKKMREYISRKALKERREKLSS